MILNIARFSLLRLSNGFDPPSFLDQSLSYTMMNAPPPVAFPLERRRSSFGALYLTLSALVKTRTTQFQIPPAIRLCVASQANLWRCYTPLCSRRARSKHRDLRRTAHKGNEPRGRANFVGKSRNPHPARFNPLLHGIQRYGEIVKLCDDLVGVKESLKADEEVRGSRVAPKCIFSGLLLVHVVALARRWARYG